MSQRVQALLREALALEVNERAEIAHELLASLDAPTTDDPEAVQAAWTAEIERRANAVAEGRTQGVAWETVRAEVARELERRRAAKGGTD